MASQVVMDNIIAQMAFKDHVAQATPASPSVAPFVTTIEDDSDGP